MYWSLRGINGLVIEDQPNFQLSCVKLCIIRDITFWHPMSVMRQKRRNSTKFKDYDSYGFSICFDVLQEKLFVPSLVCQ